MVWHHMRMPGASRAWTSGHVASAGFLPDGVPLSGQVPPRGAGAFGHMLENERHKEESDHADDETMGWVHAD